MNTITTSLTLASLLALAACNGESTDTTADATAQAPADTGPVWLLASNPGEAMSIADARAKATEGDTVTIRGIIGGRKDALSGEAGVFVLMDESVNNACVSSGDDHCGTPWDYCCASQEEIMANNASVQLVGEDGRTIAKNLREFGIEELDTVVIVGAVGARPTENVLTIRASKIFVETN